MDRWLWMARARWILVGASLWVVLALVTDDVEGPFTPIVMSLFFGFSWASRSNERRLEDARLIGSVEPEVWYPVQQALLSGELPADRELDASLRRLVEGRQHQLGGTQSPLLIVAWAVGVVVAAALAWDNPEWLLVSAGLLVAGPIWRLRISRQARRLDRLEIGLLARAGG